MQKNNVKTRENLQFLFGFVRKSRENDQKVALGGSSRVEIVDANTGESVRFATVIGNAVEMAWNGATSELAVGTSSGYVYIFKPLAPLAFLAYS